MTLQDHFHPPLSQQRHWHAFHNAWSTFLASHLNQHLPEGYFAEANVQFGIEIDVAAFGDSVAESLVGFSSWTAPAPTQTLPVPLMVDVVEVLVYEGEGGPKLVGAIELVSPANKDRPEHRAAFATKCAAYLQQGIGLSVVDMVTTRKENLHSRILERLEITQPKDSVADLYAVAYRMVQRADQAALQIWENPLTLGQSLPTVPLWLRGGFCIPVDLETTYRRTCQEYRIPLDDA